MRFIKSAAEVSSNRKKTACSLLNNVDYCEGITESGKGVTFSGENVFIPSGYNPVEVYEVDGRKLIFCDDGYLYECGENGVSKISFERYGVAPQVFTAVKKGKTVTAIVNRENSTVTLLGGNVCVFSTLCSDGYVRYKGRAFAVKENKIYFNSRQGGTSPTADCVTDTYLIVNSSYGKLLKLTVVGGNLYVFAEYGVLKVTVGNSDTDVTLKHTLKFAFKSDGRSIAVAGDCVYLVGNGRLYLFFNEKISAVDCNLQERDFTIDGGSCVVNGVYALPMKIFGGRFLYVYDTALKEESFLNSEGIEIFASGVSFDKKTREFKKISNGFGEWKVFKKETDFNFDGDKVLYSVEVKSEVSVELEITAERIKKTYVIPRSGKVYPNLRSEYFTVAIKGRGDAKKVKKIIYTLRV